MELLHWSTLVLIVSIYFTAKHLQQKKKKLPPSPPALPILGHLHLLKSSAHRALQSLSNKYGSIVYLRFGDRPTLVVSSASIAEECLTKNDIVFANRPQTLVSKHLGYNYEFFPVSPYGDYWRDIRRLTTIHIFSSLSLQNSSAVRTDEIQFTVKKLFSGTNTEIWKEVDLTSLFKEFVFDVIMKMVAGKRWSKSADVFKLANPRNICEYIPFLRWIGLGGFERKLIDLHINRDEILQDLIDEERRNTAGLCSNIDSERRTIIQALLSVQDAEPENYTDQIIKAAILTMFTAGTDTSSLTMVWAMTLLLNHPEIVKKARDEIDNHTTPGRLIEDSDLSKLHYLRCIINETLRLFPIAPLLLPHFSSEDCIINGYNVPRGTTLLLNAWAIQRDPNVWEEPTKFRPERFEGTEVGCEGFKFLPFGKGRRACPGTTLAMRLVGLALATLIQCFEWKRLGSELVDLEERNGITIHKAKPLKALYKPRLSMINSMSLP